MPETIFRSAPTRRRVLAGLAAGAASFALPARAQSALDAQSLGLVANSTADQTPALSAALEAAATAGRPLFLPAGEFRISALEIPSGTTMTGLAGRSWLVAAGDGPAARITAGSDILLEGIGFAARGNGPGGDQGLLAIDLADRITISRCRFSDSLGHGLWATGSAVTIEGCDFTGHAGAGIFSRDGKGLIASANRVSACGNGGILIWRTANGPDGSIVVGNIIGNIAANGGGNGQNGNGINVYLADGVIVADNRIADCAFTAVRLNSTNDTIVRGNVCTNSGEVAIFSEFAFSGSVIADNIVDGAATGISITNLDSGGRLATCTGNIVRNITPLSLVNPDTRPVGIFAEADTVIGGNAVDEVPGVGIMAGYGPFLRNVVIADNVITATDIGIGVSVADTPGAVRIDGNLISGARNYAIVGLAWDDIVTNDLMQDAATYPHVTMGTNTVTTEQENQQSAPTSLRGIL